MTNFIINRTVAPLFVSGETLQSLIKDIDEHERIGINAIGAYVVEGLPKMDQVLIDKFYLTMIDSIKAQTEGRDEAHQALKFTALISIDVLTRWSSAQSVYINEILKYNLQENI